MKKQLRPPSASSHAREGAGTPRLASKRSYASRRANPHISKKDMEFVVDTIFESMAQALQRGERIVTTAKGGANSSNSGIGIDGA